MYVTVWGALGLCGWLEAFHTFHCKNLPNLICDLASAAKSPV